MTAPHFYTISAGLGFAQLELMIKATLALLILATPFTSAHAYDVYGTDANFIEVTESASKLEVGFRLCSLKGEFACKQLGKSASYSKEKLISLKGSEQWDVLISIGADAMILAATGGGGGMLAYSGTAAASSAATLYGTMAGAVVGAQAGTAAIMLIDTINPYEQYMQTQTLDKKVMNDERVDVQYPVKEFAKRLTTVLGNLDQPLP
ncbi:MAG: hypothetical protein H7333_05365 [Bdellovibrionales bacterium]|nr:hypothetical protein [Oligoflexia bacterium]